MTTRRETKLSLPTGDEAPEPETDETFMANIVTMKGIQIDSNTKTERGQMISVPLKRARQYVSKKLARWGDPRPDL